MAAISPLAAMILLLAATSVACLHVESVRSIDLGRAGHAAARCAGDGPRSGPGASLGFGRRFTTIALRGGSEGEGEGEVNEVPRDDFASPPIGTPPLEDDRKHESLEAVLDTEDEETEVKPDISDRIYRLLDEAKRRGKAAIAGRYSSVEEASKRLAEETRTESPTYTTSPLARRQPSQPPARRASKAEMAVRSVASTLAGLASASLVMVAFFHAVQRIFELIDAGSTKNKPAALITYIGILFGCTLGGAIVSFTAPFGPAWHSVVCGVALHIMQALSPGTAKAPAWFKMASSLTFLPAVIHLPHPIANPKEPKNQRTCLWSIHHSYLFFSSSASTFSLTWVPCDLFLLPFFLVAVPGSPCSEAMMSLPRGLCNLCEGVDGEEGESRIVFDISLLGVSFWNFF